jgi:flavin-dependent dehydrogenase
MNMDQTDVLVVGAGIAGCAAALVLPERYTVTLIDRVETPPPRIGESLPGAARRLLQRLDLLERFAADGHRPSLGTASLWGSSLLTRRDSFTDPLGPGWRLDRVRFEAMFRTAARERCGRLIAPARLTALAQCQKGGAGWRADLRCGDMDVSLGARFLILAHGRGPLPTVLDTTVTLQAFDRLVCRFAKLPPCPTSSLSGFSLVEAVAEGWWYKATLPDEHRILAYHTDADLPSARFACSREGFAELLQATRSFGSVSLPKDATVRRASARSQALDSCCGTDWCAVGDAAAAFDPLSSQGIFNALYTGVRGAEAAMNALSGDVSALPCYREHVAQVVRAYRANLARYYGLEARFGDNRFWARRRPAAVDLAEPGEQWVQTPVPAPRRTAADVRKHLGSSI